MASMQSVSMTDVISKIRLAVGAAPLDATWSKRGDRAIGYIENAVASDFIIIEAVVRRRANRLDLFSPIAGHIVGLILSITLYFDCLFTYFNNVQ